MFDQKELADILKRFASNTAGEDELLELRSALLSGEITMTRCEESRATADGQSNVVIVGPASGAFINTGGVTLQITLAEYDRLRGLVDKRGAGKPAVDWKKRSLSSGRLLAPLLAALAMSLVADAARRFVGLDGDWQELAGTVVFGFFIALTALAGLLTLLLFLRPAAPPAKRFSGGRVFGERFKSKRAVALTGIALTAAIALRLSLPLFAYLYNERGVQFQYGQQPDLSRAGQSYRRALRLSPSDAQASYSHYYLGTAYEESEPEKAIEEYHLALKYDPQLLPARKNLARLYNDRGHQHHQKGDSSQALESYEQAVNVIPAYAQAHYNLAVAYEDLQRQDKAIAEYLLAIEFDNYIYAAYNNLARLYLLKSDRNSAEQALKLLVQAQELSPQDESPQSQSVQYSIYKNLGWANLTLEKYAQAEQDLSRAISVQPDRAAAHCLMAYLLKKLGKSGRAAAECYDCLSLFKNEPEVEAAWLSDAKECLMKRGLK